MTPAATTTGFDWRKFWKKAAIRLAYRSMEMAILVAIGFALGIRLTGFNV